MREWLRLFIRETAFEVTKSILALINGKLLDHGIRVAYIMKSLISCERELSRDELIKILFCSIFHDVGAYKTEEIDSLLRFDTDDTLPHSIYGYLFLKYLSNLGDMAEVILYHHLKYAERLNCNSEYVGLALKLHMADRVDICALTETDCDKILDKIEALAGRSFDPDDVRLLRKAQERFHIIENIRNGGYESDIKACYKSLFLSEAEIMDHIKTLVFAIDFRSEQTVLHTIQTAWYAAILGKKAGLDGEMCEKLYYSGLLHDIGKIKIPLEILEKPGSLTREEMLVMQRHVAYTREILEGGVEPEIIEIAARHHEKLNGAGYPDRLRAEELTLPQRIMAVADITSALYSTRSYRDKMPKERVITTLKNMAEANLLDKRVVFDMTENYDEITGTCENNSAETIRRYESLKREFKNCQEMYLNNKTGAAGSELFFFSHSTAAGDSLAQIKKPSAPPTA